MTELFPQIVSDKEDVARIIFSPSYIYKGHVSPSAFRWNILPSGHVEDYISVLRGNPNVLNNQTKHFKARAAGDVRYGYALLKVKSIRDISERRGGRVRRRDPLFLQKQALRVSLRGQRQRRDRNGRLQQHHAPRLS